MERMSIASFLANGHAFHLFVYSDVKDVPAGAVLRDGNEILHASSIFRYRDETGVTPASPTSSATNCSGGTAAGGSTWIRSACVPSSSPGITSSALSHTPAALIRSAEF